METENFERLRDVATMYYCNNMTQQEIADRYDISRSKVSRLLTEARQKNIVRISIADTHEGMDAFRKRFCDLFGLEDLLIVPTPIAGYKDDLRGFAQEAAPFFQNMFKPGDSIGVAWGRTLFELTANMQQRAVADTSIVQICGNFDNGDMLNYAGSIVNRLAQTLGSKEIYTLPCPVVVSNPIIVDAIGYDAKISKIIELGGRCSKLFVNMNGFTRDTCLIQGGYLSEEDWRNLEKNGAVGMMCCRYFDKNGDICYPELDRRTIGVSWEQLKNAKQVMACVTGKGKALALYTMLKAGMIDVLAVDSVLASIVLDLHEAATAEAANGQA